MNYFSRRQVSHARNFNKLAVSREFHYVSPRKFTPLDRKNLWESSFPKLVVIHFVEFIEAYAHAFIIIIIIINSKESNHPICSLHHRYLAKIRNERSAAVNKSETKLPLFVKKIQNLWKDFERSRSLSIRRMHESPQERTYDIRGTQ